MASCRFVLRTSLLLAGILSAAPPTNLVAQEQLEGPGTPLVAHRLPDGTHIQLDGRLDDAYWIEAVPVSDFTQQEPMEGAQPSRRTEVRVAYDQDHLYIGAMIYDDPAGILAYQKRRDAGLNTDDRFMVILDTFLDGRTGYFFEINAAGLMGDGILGGGGGGHGGGGGPGGWGGGGVNKSWDGIWETQVARLDDGWSAEIRIPFRTLNFDPDLDTWGINFQRTIRRNNEEILWRGYRRNQGIFRVINAGRVTGLDGMSQGLGLEARPSAVANWKNVVDAEDPTTFPNDVSLDLSYSITSSLRASLSLNTDFAEVEVDDRRVNLTRFPQRFPERRNFFLEGSGVFGFAESNGVSPYFSRRIGLVEGEQIPIRYGARVTGQAGKYEVGFIQVNTGGHDYRAEEEDVVVDAFAPAENFTIARLRRSFWSQSTLGAIYTRRSTAPQRDGSTVADRHTAGMDLSLQTSSLFGNKNAQFEMFWVWNSNPDPGESLGVGDLTARGIRFDFPNDLWSGHLSYREFGKAYDPQIGFVTRNDFRRVEPQLSWSPRPQSIDWLRQMRFSAQFTYQQNLTTGQDEERQWEFTFLDLEMESGDNVQLNGTHLFEYLDEAFEVSDGIDIMPGTYANWEWRLEGRTASRRRVSADAEVGRSGFWDGTRTSTQLGLTLRPNPGTSLSWDWERNHVDLPQGSFNASVYRMGGGWDASPWVSLNGNVQYDDVSELLGLFAKLRWIVQPGNDVFLVYTHNWERSYTNDILDRRFSTISKGGAIKVNYTYRF